MKGFVIAGTGSGSGKTTACLGTLAWLSGLGYRVAPFKVGPDFIDPGHHTALTGKISRNLDSWMLSRQTNEKIFAQGCADADVAVVEGVMGLFDGCSGTSEAGSTAQMAKWLNLPVILIVDARSMARSAAAIVQGFENFDPDLQFTGVIFSKTGSQRHYDYLKSAVESTCRMKCIGHLPRNEKIVMPERHLGLVTSDEHLVSSGTVSELINMIDRNTSLKEILSHLPDIVPQKVEPYISAGQVTEHKRTESYPSADQTTEHERTESYPSAGQSTEHERTESYPSAEQTTEHESKLPEIKPHIKPVRIAMARDKAFCFYYQENIEALEKSGAEIVEFSPISTRSLPSDIHGIYFGGGYPELFAESLSANKTLMNEIKTQSLQGMPLYGECGGFMYLCRDITVMDGTTKYPMTGCFPFSAVMSKKMRSLGYRQISLKQDTLIGSCGDVLRGHEFHYSSLEGNTIDHSVIQRVYHTAGRDGQEVSVDGYQRGNTLGSYLHVHFDSMAGAAPAFVKSCRNFAEKRHSLSNHMVE